MIKRKYMALIIFLLLFCVFAICTVIGLKEYFRSFPKVSCPSEEGFYSFITRKEAEASGYPREELSFYSGANKLQGFIYGGANNKGLIVFSHGLGSTVDSYHSLIMFFVDKGWRVFAFNNTGVAGSEGKNTRGLYQSLVDLDAALSYVESEDAFKGLPVMMVGHSWGGFAVCSVLNYEHNVKAVVSFAGYNNGSEVLKERGLGNIGNIYYMAMPQLMTMQKLMFGKTTKLCAVDGINKAGIPVMIVQCSDDNMIPAGTTSIYAHRKEITNPNVEIIYRDGEAAAGHEYVFYSPEQKEYMREADESWKLYKTKTPNPSRAGWIQEINFDKTMANELDADLMKRIGALFDQAR